MYEICWELENNTCDIFLSERFLLLTKCHSLYQKSSIPRYRSLPSIPAGESSVTKSSKPLLTGTLHYVILCIEIIRAFDSGSFLNMTASGSQVTPFHHHFWFVEAKWTSWRSQKRILAIEVFLIRRFQLQL